MNIDLLFILMLFKLINENTVQNKLYHNKVQWYLPDTF
jgi:hypothetical protein